MPLLSVSQVRKMLKGKLADDWKLKVQKEIWTLAGEVDNRLCDVWSSLRLERSAMGKSLNL